MLVWGQQHEAADVERSLLFGRMAIKNVLSCRPHFRVSPRIHSYTF